MKDIQRLHEIHHWPICEPLELGKSNGENGLVKFLRWKFGGLFRTLDAVGIVDGDAHDKTNPDDIQKINRNAAVAAAPFLEADKSIHKQSKTLPTPMQTTITRAKRLISLG
ncbi:hypothetical protein QTG54_010283 [Skeletonema marinoi]|uniref:Uncharacterized protein n=1 Tax=Skeletonema marinoi TaxID=267567 RepID=A0AAD8Y4M3_9STRA|nr:hypothetical protein QTG54_010283 [Skeletonema marinoi]